jgi:hypothetical protein
MTRKQSRRTQRALERELFGTQPCTPPPRRRTPPPAPLTPPQTPGNCAFCGNCCDLAWGRWRCAHCGVEYRAASCPEQKPAPTSESTYSAAYDAARAIEKAGL